MRYSVGLKLYVAGKKKPPVSQQQLITNVLVFVTAKTLFYCNAFLKSRYDLIQFDKIFYHCCFRVELRALSFGTEIWISMSVLVKCGVGNGLSPLHIL